METSIGKRIEQYLKKNNISQVDFGKKFGVATRQMVNKWIRGLSYPG